MPNYTTPYDDSQYLKEYDYVTDGKTAWELLWSLDHTKSYALDFETTSLAPHEGVIRLTSIYGHGKWILIDHFQAGPFEDYAIWFSQRKWIVFNACFEGLWIDTYADNTDVELLDVQFMRVAKMGGSPMMRLSYMVEKDLGLEISKDEQNSSWGDPDLTDEQLDYAAKDSRYNMMLFDYWMGELEPHQLFGVSVINDAWRATVEMEHTGLQLDVEYHAKLLSRWRLKKATAYTYLRKWTPNHLIENLSSDTQISKFLETDLDPKVIAAWPRTGKRGTLAMDKDHVRQAAYRFAYPLNRWFAALLIYKKYSKLVSTYGQQLIDAQNRLGKIPTRFNMARAVTGRYSSSRFNLQNIPNARVIRRSFIAPYRGAEPNQIIKMVMADYSSIEVRVLAEVAKDEVLLHDAIYGDVHSRSAARIFGHEFEYFCEVIAGGDEGKYANVFPAFKDMRTRAKAFTFQLLYGAGASALAIPLKCTDEEAMQAIEAWAEVFPKAYHYRQVMFETMQADGFLPVVDGRTIWVHWNDRTMPVAANYPIQGAAASAMYRALKRVHDLFLANRHIPARLAATVHDEILMFCRETHAEEAGELLIEGMIQGWLDIFPGTDTNNLVGKGNKANIGSSWGDKK